MHKIHLIDLGWKIAKLTVDSSPRLAYIELINPPTHAGDCTGMMRLEPQEALTLAAAIQAHFAHFTQTPGGHT
jgi:hypothetical protein